MLKSLALSTMTVTLLAGCIFPSDPGPRSLGIARSPAGTFTLFLPECDETAVIGLNVSVAGNIVWEADVVDPDARIVAVPDDVRVISGAIPTAGEIVFELETDQSYYGGQWRFSSDSSNDVPIVDGEKVATSSFSEPSMCE